MKSEVKQVFSNPVYVVQSVVLFVGLLFPLLILSEYIFLEPFFIGHVPSGYEFQLGLIVILSGLSGLVIPMNIYRIRVLRASKRHIGHGITGSLIGSIAGACSCSSASVAIISTFGSVGATASAFLTNYDIPIKLGAIMLLLVTYYTTIRSLKTI